MSNEQMRKITKKKARRMLAPACGRENIAAPACRICASKKAGKPRVLPAGAKARQRRRIAGGGGYAADPQ